MKGLSEIELTDPQSNKRVLMHISNYLRMWAQMKGIPEAGEELIQFYVKTLSKYSLSEIQDACDYSYERFREQRQFVQPHQIRDLIEDSRRLTPGAAHGPMRISEANFKMLELFLKAFRESKLKGAELESHLLQVVEDNYDSLGCREPVYKCQRCKDKGFIQMWFLVETGLSDSHHKDADGKWRTYQENTRVANAPTWEQEARPDFEAPTGQQLVNGVCRCECQTAAQFSFPKPPEAIPF